VNSVKVVPVLNQIIALGGASKSLSGSDAALILTTVLATIDALQLLAPVLVNVKPGDFVKLRYNLVVRALDAKQVSRSALLDENSSSGCRCV
jgi:hypothetical protein